MFKQKCNSCDTINKDGTRVLIDFKNGEKCLIPISDLFWKKSEDCDNKCVLTRNSAWKIRENNAFATKIAIGKYFNLQKIKQ